MANILQHFNVFLVQLKRNNRISPQNCNQIIETSNANFSPANMNNNVESRPTISVCSPSKPPRLRGNAHHNDAKLSQEDITTLAKSTENRNRWEETMDLMDFDDLPLLRAIAPSDDEENAPVLTLNFFVQNPVIEFPPVLPKKSRKMPLKVENPKDYSQTVQFKKCPTSKGFHILPTGDQEVKSRGVGDGSSAEAGINEIGGGVHEVCVPASSAVIQYIQFIPPSAAKGGDAFRDVWFCWVDMSYWVKVTLIAKVLEGPKKKKTNSIWKKAPKFPVIPRNKQRNVLNSIENQDDGHINQTPKTQTYVQNVNTETKVLEIKQTNALNVDNATEIISTSNNESEQQLIDRPLFENILSEKASSTKTKKEFHHGTLAQSTTAPARVSPSQKPSFENVLPDMQSKVGAFRKRTIIKPAERRRSSSALDSPVRSQSPRVSQKMALSGITGRSNSCTSTVPPPKKTKFAALSSGLREKRSPRVPQRVLDLSRFKRNQRKSKGASTIDKPTLMSPSVQLSGTGYLFFDDAATQKQLYAFKNWLNDLFLCHLNVANKQSVGSISWLRDQRSIAQTKQKVLSILKSQEIASAVLSVEKDIHAGKISIRPDIKLIFDLALRKQLIRLIMNINPVWLSLVLEIVFGDCVPPVSTKPTNFSSFNSFSDLEKFLENNFISRFDLDTTKPSQYSLNMQFSDGEGVVHELHRHILRKFFLLVILLDRAKMAKVIPQDPCLFNVDSEIKSTNVLVCQFCRLCLKSEGSIIRHLANLNYFLHFEQKALDEYSFFIENIETDLRDGVKLVKALELANSSGHNWDLMRQMRYPAEARTRKLHNVSLVINKMSEVMKVNKLVDFQGLEITPKDVVDGNSVKTAALLWHMCLDLKVCLNLISEKALRDEIEQISESSSDEKSSFVNISDVTTVSDLLIKWALVIGCHVISDLDHLNMFESPKRSVAIKDACPSQCCPLDGVLSSTILCSIVSFYLPELLSRDDVILANVVTSKDPISAMQENLELFSRAVSHIGGIPNLIQVPVQSGLISSPLDASLFTFCETPSKLDSGSIGNGVLSGSGNLKKPAVAVDRKVFLLMLASLFTRLTLIRRENEAACKIQRLWKTYRHKLAVKTRSLIIDEIPQLLLNKEIPLSQVEKTISSVDGLEERELRRNLEQIRIENDLDVSFEPNEGCHLNKRCTFLVNEEKNERADNLPLMEASFKETGVNLCMVDQPHIMELANEQENRLEDVSVIAARVIQRWLRNLFLLRKDRCKFIEIKLSVLVIQKHWKQYRRQRKFRQLVITLQAACRAYLVRKELFSNSKIAPVLLKAHNRLKNKRSCALETTRLASSLEEFSCVKISNTLRGELAERRPGSKALVSVSGGVVVASGVSDGFAGSNSSNGVVASLKYFNYQWKRLEPFIRNYAAAFISHYLRCSIRALNLRREFITTRAACIVLQKSTRKWLIVRRQRREKEKILQQKQQELEKQLQRKYEQQVKESKAALKIQSFCRSLVLVRKCREDFLRKRSAAIKLQAFIRGNLASQKYRKSRSAANTICRWYRNISYMRKTRAEYLRIKFFIAILQSNIRGYLERNHLQLQIQSAVIIQANCRRHFAKQKYITCKSACVKIQQWWKEKYAKLAAEKELRRKMELEEAAIIFTQSLIRGRIARNQFERRLEINKSVKHAFVQIRSAIIIQRAFRKVRAKLLLWYYRTRLHNSATKIQSLWRGFCLRRDLGYFTENVVIVQRAFRRYYYCKSPIENFQRCRNAAIVIQKTYRGYLVRKTSTVSVMRNAVNAISTFYIKYRDLHFRKKLEEAASTKIQSVWRGYWVRKANQIEGHAYGSISSSSSTTNYSEESTSVSSCGDVIKDNHSVTSSCSDKKGTKTTSKARRLSRICYNLRQIDPETLTLQARMDAGLACLLNLTLVSKIIPILSEIETCTRWSETCCIRFTTPSLKDNDVIEEKSKKDVIKSAAASKPSKGKEIAKPAPKKESNPRRSEPVQVLLDLMDRCCRSIADQDILLIAVTILINLAKVKTCQLDLRYDKELVKFLLTMLTKNNPSACKGTVASKLYCHTCFLIQILVTFKQCIKVAEESFRELDKLRNQFRVEMAKQKNSSKSNPHSAAAKTCKKQKPGFDYAHLHPEWELCLKRTEPATNVVLALESLLLQLQVRVPMIPR